ncbi:hypothetical protein BUALT_Bualt05G0095400 [Buddleja alternifolia]|uniref:46 kDa FK506-binding nuclear protein n=1 Tax=Buddleja alternifolia TaxID=168488 RepID=A0AAV6XMA0_9LAMI|nr:hypothetical protein BUALT_Bualt05G0095400 [Buddleja alternifolia]
MSNRGKKTTDDDDDVEQLLRAAQDDMLLKLSLNSHMARATSSAAIDPDLDRRLQALRKPQKRPQIHDSLKTNPTKLDTINNNKVDGAAAGDDLFARFAALKNSIPSYSKIEDKSDAPINPPEVREVEEESEDEVEKVIKWAIDAARLDPSPPSDNEDDDNDGSEEDDDDDIVDSRKKGKRK